MRLLHGTATLRGMQHANEDRVSVVPFSASAAASHTSPTPLLVLLADGHDGPACADHAVSRFPAAMAAASLVVPPPADASAAALTSAFAAVEAEWDALVAPPRGGAGTTPRSRASLARGVTSGACFTAALVGVGVGVGTSSSGVDVAVGNVGDARGVLRSADGSVIVMTGDHRCSNPAERARITALCVLVSFVPHRGGLRPPASSALTAHTPRPPPPPPLPSAQWRLTRHSARAHAGHS